MNYWRYLFLACLVFGLAGCSSQNPNQARLQSPIAVASDRQVKIGGFDFVTPTPLSPSPTPTPSPTPSLSPTPTPTPSVSVSPTPTPSVSPTPTPTPTPSPTPTQEPIICDMYSEKKSNCSCLEMQACVDINYRDQGFDVTRNHVCFLGKPYCLIPDYDPNTGRGNVDQYCYIETPGCNQKYETGQCVLYCWAKPVIYLYPSVPTFVSVLLDIPGRVTVSDPVYPEKGWQVLALPGSTLVTGGKTYPYLYYETEVSSPTLPQEGLTIEAAKLAPMLTMMTKQYGLNDREVDDFLNYWLPRLNQYNTKYWLVKILDHDQKQQTDKVLVNPEPDTRIELLFTFEPIDTPVALSPIKLPNTPPKRIGFTLVEWGGGISRK